MLHKTATLLIVLMLYAGAMFAQEAPVVYQNEQKSLDFGNQIQILEDKEGNLLTEQAIASGDYKDNTQPVANLEMSTSAFWVRFNITNNSNSELLTLEYPYPTIDSVKFVELLPGGGYNSVDIGEYTPVLTRYYKHQNYIFNVRIPKGETRTYLLRVRSSEQIQLPLKIGTPKTVLEDLLSKDMLFGLYAGVILVMLFYNLFVYFTVRDSIYLYYVIYIFFVGFTQACVQGYSARYMYPNSAYLANIMMVIAPCLVGVSALEFLKKFLSVKTYTPGLHKMLQVFLAVYVGILVLGFIGKYQLAAQLVQMNAGIASLLVFITGTIIARKGYRPARFFMIAWTIFLASVIIFVLRNFNVLPYNIFTYYALQIGSALEVILLSFALADKINTFRKEKEESQAQAFQALEENARIISNQNVILETKVAERTQELEKALVELKETEMQLVESEKMASLGQLTAGIAHEINNPINFVTSNVKPLKRDVDMLLTIINEVEGIGMSGSTAEEKKAKINTLKEDYDFDYLKEEIGHLLNGISEGSTRTAEIVKGLRIFSRLDEDDLKKADINEGLDSTIVIVNNLLEGRIVIEKDYGNLPMAECYPGKLNQVFLNIITNAIHALKSKFKTEPGGIVTIKTTADVENITISIKDNGTGMDEHTKKKLFEPFFTTKDVGEGTGLGLSISYNTIKKHNGSIDVISELGEGTEFLITIPTVQ